MADQQPHLSEQNGMQELVRQRYRQHLSAEQFEAVQKDLEALTEMLAAIRAVPLANHEEPFTSFIPYRREE